MKNKAFYPIIFMAASATLMFTACKKDTKEEVKDSDTSAAFDHVLASNIDNDMINISDEAGRTYSVSSFKTNDTESLLAVSCATVTLDTISSPTKTITVNFGTTNCTCNDGRTRRGALQLTFTGKYRDSLTVITVTPINYFVNDNQVAGSKTITNKGHNAANHLVYEIISNLTITKAAGAGVINWQSTRNREWTAGESTAIWSDDMYSITGNASGSTSGGSTFASVITSPLIRNMAFSCRRHFVQGVFEHTPSGKLTRIVDFGNGACDNLALVTIGGTSYTITLP